VGSRSNIELDFAYIAGFLDGDGSLMFQIKKRKDGTIGWRFMFTICFYQDSRHEKLLYWIQEKLKIEYIFKRNDNITELRINGYKQVSSILEKLMPYLKFKRKQALIILRAARILTKKSVLVLNQKERMIIADCVYQVQNENYATRTKKSKEKIFTMLGLTP
jgi:hypothetical protein